MPLVGQRWHFWLLWIWVALQFENFVVSGNEENYFALSKQFLNPDWLPNVPQFTEFAGTRLLFQYLAGTMLRFFSFESFSFVFSILGLGFLLFPLNRVFSEFKLSLIEKLLVLQLFIFLDQAFFAHSWIFGGFEAKILAYGFVFFAMQKLFKGKVWASFLLCAAATWCHVLVGGWFTLGVGLYCCFSRYSLKTVILGAALWVAIVAPFAVFLYRNTSGESLTTEQRAYADFIYTYLRTPHHTALFYHWGFFKQHFLSGLILLIGAVAGLFFYKNKDVATRNLRRLFLVFGGLLLVNLALGTLDENGSFLKLYPYRMASVALLLAVFVYLKWFGQFLKNRKWQPNYVHLIFLLLLMPNFLKNVHANFVAKSSENFRFYQDCQSISKPDEVFFFPEQACSLQGDLAFCRVAERPRFFIYKFVPATADGLLKWNEKWQEAQTLYEDLSQIQDYDIDFVVTRESLDFPELISLVEEKEGRYIYKVKK